MERCFYLCSELSYNQSVDLLLLFIQQLQFIPRIVFQPMNIEYDIANAAVTCLLFQFLIELCWISCYSPKYIFQSNDENRIAKAYWNLLTL